MNMLRQQIVQCLTAWQGDALSMHGEFIFGKDFIGFAGHFPGEPVVPGVCFVQAALCLIERGRGRSARLTEIVNAKFYAPALPEEHLAIHCVSEKKQDGSERFRALVKRGETKIAELVLAIA